MAAAVATGIFYGLFGSKLRDISSGIPRSPIVVAAHNLERGAVLTVRDVKLSTWSGSELLKGGYTSLDQIAGKTVFNPILENEPVTEARVASAGGTQGMGIASGMRAISVHAADSTGVLSLYRPGYRVDVQAETEQGGEPRLRTLLQNIEVLAIHPVEPNAGRTASPVVTLLVTPAAADRLGLADSAGRLRLLLRNPLDEGQTTLPGLNMAYLFSEANGRGEPGVTPRAPSVRTQLRSRR
ncbi:MAG: Flp pilus assembly protein CpaB [Candidatus Solibacter usitatus]|nr:Flp pilus assembly protein CpaB [Candidatus Solibacter usitatus]